MKKIDGEVMLEKLRNVSFTGQYSDVLKKEMWSVSFTGKNSDVLMREMRNVSSQVVGTCLGMLKKLRSQFHRSVHEPVWIDINLHCGRKIKQCCLDKIYKVNLNIADIIVDSAGE